MFKVEKTGENRVDIAIKGKIDSATMETALQELLDVSEGMKDGQMYYTLTEFKMPTLGALGVELRFIPSLFGLLSRFKTCALVADAGWIRVAAQIESALMPGLVIKSFKVGEEAAAEAWLSGISA